MSLMEQAEQWAAEMGTVLGRATAEQRDGNAALILRNKAYTYLKEAVDEVRECGQYVFWRNDARYVGYVSHYNRRKRRRSPTQ